jgi:hypothetical protein
MNFNECRFIAAPKCTEETMKGKWILGFFLLFFVQPRLYAQVAGGEARIEKLEALVIKQQAQIESLTQEVRDLKGIRESDQKEVKQIKAKYETWPGTTQLPKPVPEDMKVLLSGNIDVSYTDEENASSTFENGHFNPIILAKLSDNILMESEVEYETGGSEIGLEYGQIDWLLNDYMTLVAGKFLVPFGVFNERLHANWINKAPNRPLPMREVIPVDWSDTGLQMRGNIPVGDFIDFIPERITTEYAVYAVNGLEGTEGASLRDLRGASVTDDNNNKAVGGRIGVIAPPWMEGGVSLYQGAYTPRNDSHSITSFGFDGAFFWKDIAELRGEWIFTDQQIMSQTLQKDGWSLQGAYKLADLAYLLSNLPGSSFLGRCEFVLRYSTADLDTLSGGEVVADNRHQFTTGINYYIRPSFIWRVFLEKNQEDKGTTTDNDAFITMLTMGF